MFLIRYFSINILTRVHYFVILCDDYFNDLEMH